MTLFVEIVYVFITVVMILVVLLQAGRGGGLGTALGGGASQGVFGGGGGADFLAKLTQGLAAGFMICAVYLAYASAHTGSSRLQAESDETQLELVDEDEAVDYERIGEGTPLPLREPGAGAVIPSPAAIAPAEQPDEVGAAIEALEQASALPVEIEAAAGAEVEASAVEASAVEASAVEASAVEASAVSPASPPTDVEAPTAEPVPSEPTP